MLASILLAGCAQAPPKSTPLVVWEFPPQKAMESSDYVSFLEENQMVLENCTPDLQCDMALFNVAFVYAYPESPFYNQTIGLQRMEEVVQKYPESVWAYQAKAMASILKTKIAVEQQIRSELRAQLRSMENKINKLKKEIERFREIDLEIERLKDEKKNGLKSQIERPNGIDLELDRLKEDKINELKNQIERSREIDLEIDRKERELLQ